ncbi:two-component sensor histidine kinase [Actinocatenispora sera]|uniref:histidine kinase n=1 Tax=Actinocatenispora sera TaxID=390989 RepID=A0A810KUT6_9ACTN|nr:two-component sensor histidine kinase [Actinocatenispora sera]
MTAAAWRGLRQLLYGPDTPIRWPVGRGRWLRWAARIAVVAAIAVLYPVTMVTVLNAHRGEQSAIVLILAVVQLLPLVLALRYPLMGWRIGVLAALLAPAVRTAPVWGSWPWEPAQIPILAVAFVLAGLRYQRAVLWWMWAAMAGVLVVHVDAGNAPGGLAVLTIGAVLVDLIRSRLRAQRALVAETERTELEKARRAALEERTRIARELHDVVAHHMSLIVVQAQTAPYRRDDVSPGAAEELDSIAAQARSALVEMRRLLGVLRSDEDALRAPQPGLSDVDGLVAGGRRAGVRISYRAEGLEHRPPTAVQVCAYRLVQEALSNATRHAAGAPVDVTIEVTADRVRLRVHNGPGTRRGAGTGAGHGLVGMRERVALLGGDLHAGPDPDGGFTVVADLPVAEPSASPSDPPARSAARPSETSMPAAVGPEYDGGSGSPG